MTFPTPRTALMGNPPQPGYAPRKQDIVSVLEQMQAIAATEMLKDFHGAVGDLPSGGNAPGDKRAVLAVEGDGGGVYSWDGSEWVLVSALPVVLTDSLSAQEALQAAQDAAAAAQAAQDDADRAEAAAAGVEFPVSYAPQSLGAGQKAQARENIGALDIVASNAAFHDVQDLIDDDNVVIGYSGAGAQVTVEEGDHITAGAMRYQVAANNAEDHHITTAGGVKLYAVPDDQGFVSTAQLAFPLAPSDAGHRATFAYATFKKIRWSPGEYRIRNFVRVYADTYTIFEQGCVIYKDTPTELLFCNADEDDDTTTEYDGDGNIDFHGPVEFTMWDDPPHPALMPYGFVHAEGIRVTGYPGRATVRDGQVRHVFEFNACRDWYVRGYDFLRFTANTGDEHLCEVIQWDGAFGAGHFPFAPGAIDDTPCEIFEISDCYFNDVYTAFGAHHGTAIEHAGARLFNNVIHEPKDEAIRARRLRHARVYDNIIVGGPIRAIRVQDSFFTSLSGNAVLDNEDDNDACVWITNSVGIVFDETNIISYSSAHPTYTKGISVGHSVSPSLKCSVSTKGVRPGSDSGAPVVFNNSLETEINGLTQIFSGDAYSGTLTLLSDVTQYEYLLVATGVVGAGLYSTSIVRGFGGPIRVDEDVARIWTASGYLHATFPTSTSMTIVNADDPVRHIYGVNRRRVDA